MTRYSFAFCILSILISTQAPSAQTPSRDREMGLIPGVPYAVSDAGNINLTNGNLVYSSTLGNLPQGRGSAAAGLFLLYNSKLWKKHIEEIPRQGGGGTTRQTFLGGDPEGGWNYGTSYRLLVTSRNDGLDEPLQICNRPGDSPNLDAIYVTKVQIESPDGSKREFWPTGHTIPSTVHGRYFNVHPNGRITTVSGCGSTSTQSSAPFMTYYSVDGSYMNLKVYPNVSWELSMPDGSMVKNLSGEAQKIYDRNGNYAVFGGVILPDGTSAIGWVDQFGRYVAHKTNSPTEDTIYQFGFGGQLLQTKVRWKEITVMKKYQTECADCTFTRGQTSTQVAQMFFRVVDSIEAPNGRVTKYEYHAHDGRVAFDPSGGTTNQNWSPGWGEVRSLTMPSNAKTEYNYKIYTEPIFNEIQITPTLVMDRSGRITEKAMSYQDEYGGVITQRHDKWLYTSGRNGGGFVGPDGRGSGQAVFNIDSNEDLGGQVYRTSNGDGTVTEKFWQFNNPAGFSPGKPVNPYVKAEFYTVLDAGGNPSLTSFTHFTYDKNGNVTQADEYDWVPYDSIPRDSSGRVNGLPAGPLPLLRTTKTAYYNSTPVASDTSTIPPNAFWKASPPRLRSLVAGVEVLNNSGAPQSRTELRYDYVNYDAGNSVGGNPTETKSWDSYKNGIPRSYSNPLTSANSVNTSATYNSYGMLVASTDARGFITQTTYGDIAGPWGVVTDLYPTNTVTAYGTTAARTVSSGYDFHTGLSTSTKDVDNNVSSITDYDAFGRPTKLISAAGTPRESWIRTEYDDVARRIVVRSDVETVGDGRKISVRHFDQLGRERLRRTLENIATEDPYNESHGIKVETRYGYNDPTPDDPNDPASTLGEFTLVSNPYRSPRPDQGNNDESMGWTRTYSHENGRRIETQTFTGPSLPYPWGPNSDSNGLTYTDLDANVSTNTDQAGKRVRNIANGVGQLIRVDEPNSSGELGDINSPAQPTFYTYNALGNLVRVAQGVQARDFMYDSLGRLVRVRQPEQSSNAVLNTVGNPTNNSWTAGFTYDDNGNQLSSRDARNIVVTNVYDPQNRPTSRSYSDSTPAVTYTYDSPGIPFSRGKLTKISSSVSELRYLVYDENGRLNKSEQVTDGRAYVSGFGYNLAGTVIEQTYPSGRVLNNFLETDGDIGSISSKVINGRFRNYAANISYTPSGTIKHLQLGNGLWESARRNSRSQVTELNLGNSQTDGSSWKLSYSYGQMDASGNVDARANDGNIAKQVIRVPGMQDAFVQTYRYDAVDRIVEAKETVGSSPTWSQTFGYDRYGNRTSFAQEINGQPSTPGNLTLPQIDPTTNRFQTGQGYAYDLAGNLIRDPDGRQFVFNGENKQILVRDERDVTIGEYRYDGSGRRVKKITAGETTVFVYDGFGKLAAEMSSRTPAPNPTVNYTATDPLGSPRVLTDSRGRVVSRRDFMPFGEELASEVVYRTTNLKYSVTDSVRKKFTGYERDEETELDFAEARYYNDLHGRFTAVDPLIASGRSANPQTFNRYVYSLNRPLVLTDPTGLQAGNRSGYVIPPYIRQLAAETTLPTTTDTTAVLPASMVKLKKELAVIAYEGQAAIANQNEANLKTGTELNPERASVMDQTGQTDSTSVTKETSATVGISKDGPNGSVGAKDSEAATSTKSDSSGTHISGAVTNTTGDLKELLKTTNKMIGNYLNTVENKNGGISMPVKLKDGTVVNGNFTRQNVRKYLERYVDNVRNSATCDYSPTSCKRLEE